MDEKIRQSAVDDLLQSCRDNGRGVGDGRMLAPALLGREWHNEQDDALLIARITDMLTDALSQRQQMLGLAPTLPTSNAIDWLHAIARQQDQPLQQLGFAYAYYIAQLETKFIATHTTTEVRMVQIKVQQARRTLAASIAKRPISTRPSVAPTPPSQEAAPPAPEPPPLNQAPTIQGKNVQSVSGTVGGSVFQHQTQHIYTHAAKGTQTQADDAAILLFGMVLLGVGFWLLSTAPWLSLTLIGGLILWRGGNHIVLARRWLTTPTDADERWWQAGYALGWLAALGWVIVLAIQLGTGSAIGLGLDNLWLVVRFVGLLGHLAMLEIVDLYLAVLRSPNPRWPLRLLAGRAMWFWNQRWLLLLVTWLPLLAVIAFTFFLPR